MIGPVLVWGIAVGLLHFVLMGMIYGNPLVDRMYARAASESPAVKAWPSKPRYLLTQFLGTQVEVFILVAAFLWLRPLVDLPGMLGAAVLGGVFAAIRVYPRFWNMWIQTTYPNELLAIEFVNGSVGTIAIAVILQSLALS